MRRGGPLPIVDNLGDDEFTALASRDITADCTYWESSGFECRPVGTHFEFENMADAQFSTVVDSILAILLTLG